MNLIDPAAQERLHALLRRPAVARVMDVMNAGGIETRIVGGAVRNTLLNRPVNDIDLATTALPEQTTTVGEKAGLRTIPTGVEHGTVTLIANGQTFETTTLREDVETDGRRAKVRFGQDFSADAHRRDFTLNALSLDAQGDVHDDVGGLADLAARRVRFIGDADRRIREDYLRILRLFRFHAEYGEGALDADARDACVRHRAGLDGLSRERVRAEMLKLLMAPGSVAMIEEMSDAGLLSRLFGGVGEGGRFARLVATGADATARLAGLGVMTGADVSRLRDRLRLTNAETAFLDAYAAALEALKMVGRLDEPDDVRRFAYRFGASTARTVFDAIGGDVTIRIADAARAFIDAGADLAPQFPILAKDLIARGMAPGPALGAALREVERLWLDAGMPQDEVALSALLNQVAAGS